MDEPLLPAGYLEFLRDKTILHYEDEYVKAERLPNGQVEITGKPFKDVFIYEK